MIFNPQGNVSSHADKKNANYLSQFTPPENPKSPLKLYFTQY